jgi:DNA-binding MarR family transcriptional regulator
VPNQLSSMQLDILERMVVTPEPAFIASEFIEDLDYTEEGVRYNLEKLVECDCVERKKPGPRTVLYWITKHGREVYNEHAGSG